MSDEETKNVLKEALREWLDEKFAQFGRWSVTAFCSAALVGVVYFLLSAYGYHK